MSVREVMHLLNVCEIYSKTLVAVIYDCGLRCLEACHLKWSDINFDRRQVHIKKGKCGKDRIVPISESVIKVLGVYRRRFPSRDYVFKGVDAKPLNNFSVRKRLKEVLTKAELAPSLTTHSLRHSYATHLLDAGEDIQTVQQRLRHKSVSTTMTYLHLAKVGRQQYICLIDNNLSTLR